MNDFIDNKNRNQTTFFDYKGKNDEEFNWQSKIDFL